MLRGRLNVVIWSVILSGATSLLFTAQQAHSASALHNFITQILSPIQINKQDDLQFGTISPDSAQSGSVIVHPGSENNSTCGASLLCITGGDRAKFRVTGLALQLVNISISNSIVLTNPAGDSMLVDNFMTDSTYNGGLLLLLLGLGSIDVGVGATLHVNANQEVGDYTGSFLVTAEYQ